jgi:hypothetical protein
MRVITIQCEQYGATVHLFIGTGHSPSKSTFVFSTFIHNYNINPLGPGSLFLFGPASCLILIIVISQRCYSSATTSAFILIIFGRDGNFTRGFGYPRISDPSVSGSGTKFNPRVSPIPDPW